MKHILQSYLRKLTNLSSSNRSLLLTRLYKDQFVDVHQFDFLLNKPSFHIIDDLISGKKRVPLCQVLDARDDASNQLSVQLRRIQRTDQFVYEERGSRDLYIGWPFVRGKFSDGTVTRCPLLFFPVSLQASEKKWYLTLRRSVNITLNKSFLLAYSFFNKVELSDELVEAVFDDFGTDSRSFRTALYQLFKDSPVEINFNQENFTDQLRPFVSRNKSELDEMEQQGELKLFPEAVLGMFPQADSYLVPDYLYLLDNEPSTMENLFAGPGLSETDRPPDFKINYYLDKVREEQLVTPLKIDAYQENAIKAVKEGKSVVVQGPPGTGKSQLICNLIADQLAGGKRVLLVCQKRAALDVVKERLSALGAGMFLGLVHDIKSDRKRIYDQLSKQIDSLEEYESKNSSLDSIQLERTFQLASRRIDQITEQLEELKSALYDTTECGISVKQLYLTSNREAPFIALNQEYRNFHFDKEDEFIRYLEQFVLYARRFRKQGYAWQKRKSFAEFSITDLKTIEALIEDVSDFSQYFSKASENMLSSSISLREGLHIYDRREKIGELVSLLYSDDIYEHLKRLISYNDNQTDLLWLSNQERVLMDCYNIPGPEVSLSSSELGHFMEVLQKAIETKNNILKWFWWKLFSKDRSWVLQVLRANQLSTSRKDFNVLVQRVDNRLNLEHNLTRLKQTEWLGKIPETYDKGIIQDWFEDIRQAVKAKLLFTSFRNFKEFFSLRSISREQFIQALEGLQQLLGEIPEHAQRWETHLDPYQLQLLLDEPDAKAQMIDSLRRDFEDLCAFDRLKRELAGYQRDTMERLLDESYSTATEDLVSLFKNSIRLTWIEHIETKYPALRMVSSMQFGQLEKELQEKVKEKLKVSSEIFLIKAREKTYENLEYNRLNNRVTYREVKHQVEKKKRIWPLRKLIHQNADEVFKLVPCWIVSPEAASALFPMEPVFDLVIFDEASQCFAEKGLPAIYRGKQLVVAGDDKQLQPNDLYQIRWEEEDVDEAILEIDSLLHLAEQFLPQVSLQGHYRSKTLDLIEFSNRHFYEGKLRILPDFEDANRAAPSISYEKVEGIWQQQTNPAEAEKVISLIWQLHASNPSQSIGVVTFNVRQQNLILDLLDASGRSIPGNLFVKNIENVQGDERDVIIFSTAYAPDDKGRMMMQFGSLNAQGGENRLNVAVTRAREKIVIVTSIFPHQLKVDETRNEGPKLLRAYLEYALDVSKGNFIPEVEVTPEHAAQWYLKQQIKNELKQLFPELSLDYPLPFADITVKKDGTFIGLIYTDDELYYQSLSMKAAHVYQPFQLHGKNWRFTGVFSRQFWAGRQEVIENLMRFIDLQLRTVR